ncbi:MAG: hypothetical protein HYT87_11960 [Nitrospirae bacterium]|nr:hypothetical protein [Nitrospirota bacterium]
MNVLGQPGVSVKKESSGDDVTLEEILDHVHNDGESRFTSITTSGKVARGYALCGKEWHGVIVTALPDSGSILDPLPILKKAIKNPNVDRRTLLRIKEAMEKVTKDRELFVKDGLLPSQIISRRIVGSRAQPALECEGNG